MKLSPLNDRHTQLGARLAPFAGWNMPIQYVGIVAEHQAVREKGGIFDISHMGEFEVVGPGVVEGLNRLLTNNITSLEDGQGQYTLMLNPSGGVIDDLIVYRFSKERFFLVVNAARIQEDRNWLISRLGDECELKDRSDEFGAVAVQGPEVIAVWNKMEPRRALPERNGLVEYDDGVVVCRTGYTGEDGFELFAPVEAIGSWFDRFIAEGVIPAGLGARDTLRLEKCYPLNGSDLDEEHTPLEAGLGFFVKLDKPGDFVGREVLAYQREGGLKRKLAAIAMTGKAPPIRHGYEVRDADGESILGHLSSGSLSPSLGKGIGMAYLDVDMCRPGTELSVAVRDRVFPAVVVKKPFI